jgi:hypothetical protein
VGAGDMNKELNQRILSYLQSYETELVYEIEKQEHDFDGAQENTEQDWRDCISCQGRGEYPDLLLLDGLAKVIKDLQEVEYE